MLGHALRTLGRNLKTKLISSQFVRFDFAERRRALAAFGSKVIADRDGWRLDIDAGAASTALVGCEPNSCLVSFYYAA